MQSFNFTGPTISSNFHIEDLLETFDFSMQPPPTSVIKATSSDIFSMQTVAVVTNLYAFERMAPESYQSGFYKRNGI